MSILKVLPASSVASAEHADILLELAFLMTAVDGKLRDEELAAYREVIGRVRGHAATDEILDGLIARFSGNVSPPEIRNRVRALAPKLPANLRETAFKLAMGLALVDHDGSPEEDDLVGVFAEALALPAPRAEAIASDVRVAFGLE